MLGSQLDKILYERKIKKTVFSKLLGISPGYLSKILQRKVIDEQLNKKILALLDLPDDYFNLDEEPGAKKIIGDGNNLNVGTGNNINNAGQRERELQVENTHLRFENNLLKDRIDELKTRIMELKETIEILKTKG